MRSELPDAFVAGVRQLGLDDARLATVVEQFLRYRQELLDWNTRINLTAITDPEEVLLKHFLDSLSLLLVYDRAETRLLDIGTGAGFPGLPLKIVRPQWQVVLLEATGKKVAFLQHIIEALQLKDVVALHGRAEELAHKAGYRASFDVVTARAARQVGAALKDDVPVTLPGLEDGRRLLVWEQVRKCPAQFPRSGTVMAKK